MPNKKILILAFHLFVLLVFDSCVHRKTFREVADKTLTLQLRNISSASDPKDITYAARLIPEKELKAAKGQAVKTSLLYKMDSCFYLQSGARKVYANIEPVANGLTGTYEYLLTF